MRREPRGPRRVGLTPPLQSLPRLSMDLQKCKPPWNGSSPCWASSWSAWRRAEEGRDPVLRLYIDHLDRGPGGDRAVTLDDCVAANDGLVAWLDVEFPSLRERREPGDLQPRAGAPPGQARAFPAVPGPALPGPDRRAPSTGRNGSKAGSELAPKRAVTLEEDGVFKTIPFEAIQQARLAPFDEQKAPPPAPGPGRVAGPT